MATDLSSTQDVCLQINGRYPPNYSTTELFLAGGKLGFKTADDVLHSGASVNTGQYTHVVITRDQITGGKQIYVNGVLDASAYGPTNDLAINQLKLFYDPNDDGLAGMLDEIEIYSGVLSSNEVAHLYGNPGSSVADTVPGGGGVINSVSFNTALNTTKLIWTTSGDTNWFTENSEAFDGASAAEAVVSYPQTSVLQTTLTGPGVVSFAWKAVDPSGSGNFVFEFDVDGYYTAALYGEQPWARRGIYYLGPGDHTLTWTAYAWSSVSLSNAAYLDQVIFTATTPPVITEQPHNQTATTGYDVMLSVLATSDDGTTNYQWFKVGSGAIPGAVKASYYIMGSTDAASVAGDYYVVVSSQYESVTSEVASITFVVGSTPPGWALATRPAGNSNYFNYVASLVDSNGNLYTSGSFAGPTVIGTNTYYTDPDGMGLAIIKHSSSGAILWSRAFTNSGSSGNRIYPDALAATPDGGVYATGDYNGTNYMGTNRLIAGTFEYIDSGIWLARFDPNGGLLWLKNVAPSASLGMEHCTMVSDESGNVTLVGSFQGTNTFGTNTLISPSMCCVLLQYDAAGNFRWFQTNSSAVPTHLTYASGRLYYARDHYAAGIPGTLGGQTIITDRASILAALDNATGLPLWQKGIGSGNGDSVHVAISGSDLVVVGNAAYRNTAVFGPVSVTNSSSPFHYFARFDTNGNTIIAKTFGGQRTIVFDVVADSYDVYIGGDYDTYCDFGNNKVLAAPVLGGFGLFTHGFVAKFDRDGVAQWARSGTAVNDTGFINFRSIALAPDGLWAVGFFNGIGSFGTNSVQSYNLTSYGITNYWWSPVLGKITEIPVAQPAPLTSLRFSGSSFQFQFPSQSGFTHTVQYRTDLTSSVWHNYAVVTGEAA